jgi:type VI secretion system secreted protein VgrG
MEPPGDCTKARHALLQQQVHKYCHETEEIKESDSCAELERKRQQDLNCAKERERINKECFRGGLYGHMTAAANARIRAAKALRIFNEKNCR